MDLISSGTNLAGRFAVHDLEGDSRHCGNINSNYDDPHDATGRFDFVLANQPFNDSDWFRKDDEVRWQILSRKKESPSTLAA